MALFGLSSVRLHVYETVNIPGASCTADVTRTQTLIVGDSLGKRI
jgi:hypothetical protein